MIHNKKAQEEPFLGKELMGAIAAIIGAIIIIIFISILYRSYYNSNASEGAEQARDFSSTLYSKINAITLNQNSSKIIQPIEGDWYIIGWSYDSLGRPDKCLAKSCICLCPKPAPDSCQTRNGFCNTFTKEKIETLTFDKEKTTTQYQAGGIPLPIGSIVPKNSLFIGIGKNQQTGLLDIKIEKTSDKIALSYYTANYANLK